MNNWNQIYGKNWVFQQGGIEVYIDLPQLDELLERVNLMEKRFQALQEEINAKNQPVKEFLTVQETADILGLHYNTVYRRVVSGELKSIRSLRHYRIERKDLDDFVIRSKGRY